MRKFRSKKGSATLELAMVAFLFMSFVAISARVSITILDVSRAARASGMAGEMVHQIYTESATPTNANLDLVPQILRSSGFIEDTEDYRMVVSVIENVGGTGHQATSLTYHGPNATQQSKVIIRNDSEAEPGVHIGEHIYTLLAGEKLYVVELFTGRRAKTDSQGGALPFYELSIFLDGV